MTLSSPTAETTPIYSCLTPSSSYSPQVITIPETVLVSTTQVVWNPLSVTVTKTKVAYRTVWRKCGGGY